MKFLYLRDRLFLFCLTLYGVNRWLFKPYTHIAFFHDSLNDLICIPFWVPIMLWAMRKTRLRTDDAPPQWYEILIPLLLWSFLFEEYLPHVRPFRHLATADVMDILWYTVGALLAALIWGWWYGRTGSMRERIRR